MAIYDNFSYRPFDGGEVKEYATEGEYYEIMKEEKEDKKDD